MCSLCLLSAYVAPSDFPLVRQLLDLVATPTRDASSESALWDVNLLFTDGYSSYHLKLMKLYLLDKDYQKS